jgi:hypothetical protein
MPIERKTSDGGTARRLVERIRKELRIAARELQASDPHWDEQANSTVVGVPNPVHSLPDSVKNIANISAYVLGQTDTPPNLQ